MGFGLGLHEVHQRAEKAAAVRGGDQPKGIAVAGGERAGRRVGGVTELGNGAFNLLAGRRLDVVVAVHHVRYGGARNARQRRDIFQCHHRPTPELRLKKWVRRAEPLSGCV